MRQSVFSIKAAVGLFLEANPKVKERKQEGDIKSLWGKVTGEQVAKRTVNIYKKGKTLFVKVSSPAIKHDLLYRQGGIITSLNSLLGEDSRINNIFWY